MESSRFDALARLVAVRISRRAALAAAVGTLAGAAPRAADATVCSNPGEGCGRKAAGAKCCAKSVCDTTRGVCLGRAGVACTDRTQCQGSLACRAGVCATPARNGQLCVLDADCVIGHVCDEGLCRIPEGAKCTANTTCATGLVCRGSVCATRGMPEEACDELADCLPNMTCVRRKCKAAVGAACARNSHCPTGSFCRTMPDTSKVCAVGGCSDYDCGGASCPACASGRFCEVGLDCESGQCIDGRCA
jgi:hypothetical protein